MCLRTPVGEPHVRKTSTSHAIAQNIFFIARAIAQHQKSGADLHSRSDGFFLYDSNDFGIFLELACIARPAVFFNWFE